MSVSNGQLANQSTFNNAFLSRTTNSSTVGQVTLQNTDTESGSTVTNIQRELNSIASFLGKSTNVAKDVIPAWTNSTVGASSDDIFDRANALTIKLNNHTHSGAPGEGPIIEAANLGSFNNLFGQVVRLEGVAVLPGASGDFTSEMGVRVPANDDTEVGVLIDDVPEARVRLRSSLQPLVTPEGWEIFGRWSPVDDGMGGWEWPLVYYAFDPDNGEVAVNLPTVDNLTLFFMEIFTAGTRPTMQQINSEMVPFGGTGGGGTGGGVEILTFASTGFAFQPDAYEHSARFNGTSNESLSVIDTVDALDGARAVIINTVSYILTIPASATGIYKQNGDKVLAQGESVTYEYVAALGGVVEVV